MKKLLIISLGFVVIAIAAVGCGQSGTSTDGTTLTPTPTPTLGTAITISGNLSGGVISTKGIKISSNTDVTGYTVVAVDNTSGKTYYSTVDDSGKFSIDATSGTSYEVSLIDKDLRYAGPIVMSGNISSTEVIMGVTPIATTELGEIVFDSSKGYAKPTAEPSSILNIADKANASSGIPNGAGNFGKGAATITTATREGSDMDKDGIPNIFDADENGDGIRNGILEKPKSASVVSSNISSVHQAITLWVGHGVPLITEDQIDIFLFVRPVTGKEALISEVKAVNVPSSISNEAEVWNVQSFGAPEGYPAERTLWKNVGYSLYKLTSGSETYWIIKIKPKALLNVGDIFMIRVSYTDGTSEDFFASISCFYTGVSKITTYNGISVPSSGGGIETPITFETSSSVYTFEVTKPLDESGNVIEGLNYKMRRVYLGPSDAWLFEDALPITDTGGITLTYTTVLSAEVNGTPVLKYYLCSVAETADAQQGNGENIYFKRP